MELSSPEEDELHQAVCGRIESHALKIQKLAGRLDETQKGPREAPKTRRKPRRRRKKSLEESQPIEEPLEEPVEEPIEEPVDTAKETSSKVLCKVTGHDGSPDAPTGGK